MNGNKEFIQLVVYNFNIVILFKSNDDQKVCRGAG